MRPLGRKAKQMLKLAEDLRDLLKRAYELSTELPAIDRLRLLQLAAEAENLVARLRSEPS